MIVSPKDMKDLFEEGRKLNHCVGSYSDRIIAGTSCIMFIRKTEDPDKPILRLRSIVKMDLSCSSVPIQIGLSVTGAKVTL